MDYMEPNMEIIELDVLGHTIRTSSGGLGTGDGFNDESGFDDL